jgi:uncharacterized tellurite resistance protein B-like protein
MIAMDENKRNEHLSLLKELIKMAKADNDVRQIEFEFLLILAEQMGITKDEFLKLFEQYIEFHPPKMEFDRILQFQRLILVMNIDQQMTDEELDYIRQLGIRMGLQPAATDEVLKIMNNYPNKVVPPDKLIEIFKTYNN